MDVERLEERLALSALTNEYLLIVDFGHDAVKRYDGTNGEFVGDFVPHKSGGMNSPYGVLFGPDGNGDGQKDLYISAGLFVGPGQPKEVFRYDGVTGDFIDVFTQGGNLESPRGLIFGPDGDLYVADRSAGDTFPLGRVARFDGTTGQYIDDFVTLGSGGLSLPQGLVFGPSVENANQLDLYASSADTNAVLRYHGDTGEFLGEFVASGAGGLDHPIFLTFGPSGDLYVSSIFDNPAVLRYQGPTGETPGDFVETFIPPGTGGMLDPFGLIFGPDANEDGVQDLYVGNSRLQSSLQGKDGTVKRFDGVNGEFIDTFVEKKSGKLDDPLGLTFSQTDSTTLAYSDRVGSDSVLLTGWLSEETALASPSGTTSLFAASSPVRPLVPPYSSEDENVEILVLAAAPPLQLRPDDAPGGVVKHRTDWEFPTVEDEAATNGSWNTAVDALFAGIEGELRQRAF